MSSYCQIIQLMEPVPTSPIPVSDSGQPLSIEEGGALALTSGIVEYTVIFTYAKSGADYDFIESDIDNDVDGSPLTIVPTMSDRTIDGFTLTLDSEPDSSNYIFHWRVRVTSV